VSLITGAPLREHALRHESPGPVSANNSPESTEVCRP